MEVVYLHVQIHQPVLVVQFYQNSLKKLIITFIFLAGITFIGF